MKKLIIFLFLFVLVSSSVFAISSSSSDGTITDKSATGAAAAKGVSSDSSISSTISAGASAVASAYSSTDGTISGKSGFPVTNPATTTPTTTTTTTTDTSAIPKGGSSGGGVVTESSSEASAESGTTEATSEAAEATTTEATSGAADMSGQAFLAPATIEVAAVMTEGQSLSLPPSMVPQSASASLVVTQVTETTVSFEIQGLNEAGQMITGAVVATVGEVVTLQKGEYADIDTNNDGTIEMRISITDIKLENGEYKSYFDITYYTNDFNTKHFVQKQIENGEVTSVISQTQLWYGVWVIVGIIVLFSASIIISSIRAAKKKKRFQSIAEIKKRMFK